MIDILMATYNGAQFLEQQLASIEQQTFGGWHLIVRDDGSTDATPDILRAFGDKHPGRVTVVDDQLGNLGAQENFNRLLSLSKAPYISFADQDDIWIPEKLKISLRALHALEGPEGETPTMVFSDRAFLNESDPDAEGHWSASEGLPLSIGSRFEETLFLNVVAGCTVLMNRPLADIAAPIPARAKSHDHWISLVATQFAAIDCLDRPTVRWRRHATNVAGARKSTANNYLARAQLLFGNLPVHRKRYDGLYRQAEALLSLHGERMAPEARMHLEGVLSLPGRSMIGRYLMAHRLGVLPDRPERKLGFLLTGGGTGS